LSLIQVYIFEICVFDTHHEEVWKKIVWTPLMGRCTFLRPCEVACARSKTFFLPVSHVYIKLKLLQGDRTQKNPIKINSSYCSIYFISGLLQYVVHENVKFYFCVYFRKVKAITAPSRVGRSASVCLQRDEQGMCTFYILK
jgi:hypothetical protein